MNKIIKLTHTVKGVGRMCLYVRPSEVIGYAVSADLKETYVVLSNGDKFYCDEEPEEIGNLLFPGAKAAPAPSNSKPARIDNAIAESKIGDAARVDAARVDDTRKSTNAKTPASPKIRKQ